MADFRNQKHSMNKKEGFVYGKRTPFNFPLTERTPSMRTLIVWNISKAFERNPDLELKASLQAAQDRLSSDDYDLKNSLSEHPEERYIACAMLAWQQLGHKDADSLYRFIETRLNDLEPNSKCSVCEEQTDLLMDSELLGLGEYIDRRSLCGPVIKLPIDLSSKVVLRLENFKYANKDGNVPTSTKAPPPPQPPPPPGPPVSCEHIEKKLEEACCTHTSCHERLSDLDAAMKELKERATKLATREAERLQLIERAEAAWKDLEKGYQDRLRSVEDREQDLLSKSHKLYNERNSFKEVSMNLVEDLKKQTESVEMLDKQLVSIEEEICKKGMERMKKSHDAANSDAELYKEQSQLNQYARDLQIKEDQVRRKAANYLCQVDVLLALTSDSERALRSELSGLKEEIQQVSEKLMVENDKINKRKVEIQSIRNEKEQLTSNMEGCKRMCDLRMQDAQKIMQKKREELQTLKDKVIECKCKMPIERAVEVKRTPSFAALCDCEPEDHLTRSCSCTSLRTSLLSYVLEDLFRGLQSELSDTKLEMPCQMLKCFDDKHNWNRASVVKTNLRNFFCRLLIGELNIAIVNAIEKCHFRWVGQSCVEAINKSLHHEAPYLSPKWQEKAIERKAHKLAQEIAQKMFQEKAEELLEKAQKIVDDGPPCSCEPDSQATSSVARSCANPCSCCNTCREPLEQQKDIKRSGCCTREPTKENQSEVKMSEVKQTEIKKPEVKVPEVNTPEVRMPRVKMTQCQNVKQLEESKPDKKDAEERKLKKNEDPSCDCDPNWKAVFTCMFDQQMGNLVHTKPDNNPNIHTNSSVSSNSQEQASLLIDVAELTNTIVNSCNNSNSSSPRDIECAIPALNVKELETNSRDTNNDISSYLYKSDENHDRLTILKFDEGCNTELDGKAKTIASYEYNPTKQVHQNKILGLTQFLIKSSGAPVPKVTDVTDVSIKNVTKKIIGRKSRIRDVKRDIKEWKQKKNAFRCPGRKLSTVHEIGASNVSKKTVINKKPPKSQKRATSCLSLVTPWIENRVTGPVSVYTRNFCRRDDFIVSVDREDCETRGEIVEKNEKRDGIKNRQQKLANNTEKLENNLNQPKNMVNMTSSSLKYNDFLQLRFQIQNLKKNAIKKQDLEVMEKKITESILNSIPEKQAGNADQQKPNKMKPKRKIQSNTITGYRRPCDTFAVNMCFCDQNKSVKMPEPPGAEQTQLNSELNKISTIKPQPNMHTVNLMPGVSQITPQCNSGPCFHKAPSNLSLDNLLNTIITWRCDVNECVIASQFDENENKTIKDYFDCETNTSDIKQSISLLSNKANKSSSLIMDLSSTISSPAQEDDSNMSAQDSPMPTPSEYVAAINLEKSNDSFCKCESDCKTKIKNSTLKFVEKSCNCKGFSKRIMVEQSIQEDLCAQKLWDLNKFLEHNNKYDNKTSILLKQSHEAYSKNIDNVQSIALSTKSLRNDKTSPEMPRTGKVKVQSNKSVMKQSTGVGSVAYMMKSIPEMKNATTSDYCSIFKPTEQISNDDDYDVKLLGVTLTNVTNDETRENSHRNERTFDNVFVNTHNNSDGEKERIIKDILIDVAYPKPRDDFMYKTSIKTKPSRDKEVHYVPKTCACDANMKEIRFLLDRALTKDYDGKSKGDETKSICENLSDRTESCVCCMNDLELNTFKLLEDYLKEKLQKIKLESQPPSFKSSGDDKIFSTLLHKIKNVINESTNVTSCKCSGKQDVIEDTWKRANSLMQEYLKIKIKRVQCLCNKTEEIVLSKVVEKVSTLIENDFERLKDMFKYKINNFDEKPERDINKSEITSQNKQRSTKSEIIQSPSEPIFVESVMSQVTSNLECQNLKEINRIHEKIVETETPFMGMCDYSTETTTEIMNKSTDSPRMELLSSILMDRCTGFEGADLLVETIKELQSGSMPKEKNVESITNDLAIDCISKVKSFPYIGYTIDCTCDSNFGRYCNKTFIKTQNETMNDILKIYTRKQSTRNVSYIMGNVNQLNVENLSKLQSGCVVAKSCETNEMEVVLKNSLEMCKKRPINTTTNTIDFGEVENYRVTVTNELSDTRMRDGRHQTPKAKSVHFLNDSFRSDAFPNTDEMYLRKEEKCECSLIPLCYVKSLIGHIENKLLNSECICDAMSDACPMHSKNEKKIPADDTM